MHSIVCIVVDRRNIFFQDLGLVFTISFDFVRLIFFARFEV
jgi:hypothetical protein